MTGVGTISRWYRDGVMDGDDEVRCCTGRLTPTSRLDDPTGKSQMESLAREGQRGEQGTRTLVLARAAELCFTERTLENILDPLGENFDADS